MSRWSDDVRARMLDVSAPGWSVRCVGAVGSPDECVAFVGRGQGVDRPMVLVTREPGVDGRVMVAGYAAGGSTWPESLAFGAQHEVSRLVSDAYMAVRVPLVATERSEGGSGV